LSKYKLHLFGWITLLVFPIPAFWCLWYFEKMEILDFLQLDRIWNIKTALGSYRSALVLEKNCYSELEFNII